MTGLLECEQGGTLDEMIAPTGFLPHTTGAALTDLKKGHMIEKSKRDEANCYRPGERLSMSKLDQQLAELDSMPKVAPGDWWAKLTGHPVLKAPRCYGWHSPTSCK